MKHLIKAYTPDTETKCKNPMPGIIWGVQWRQTAMLQDEELLYRYQEIMQPPRQKERRALPAARLPLKAGFQVEPPRSIKWAKWGMTKAALKGA